MKGAVQKRAAGEALPRERVAASAKLGKSPVELAKRAAARRQDAVVYARNGWQLFEAGQHDEARAAWDEGERRYPEQIQLFDVARGYALVQTGDFPAGLELISKYDLAFIEDRRKGQTGIVDNFPKVFYNLQVDEAAVEAIKPAADYFGLPIEIVGQTLAALRANAARETTGRVEGEPRLPLRAVVREDKTLGRLRRRYEERLASIELPPEGFTEKEQALAAARLSETYRRLRDRQIEHRLEPTPKDKRVTEAERLRGIYDRAHPPERSRRKTKLTLRNGQLTLE